MISNSREILFRAVMSCSQLQDKIWEWPGNEARSGNETKHTFIPDYYCLEARSGNETKVWE